MCYPGIVNDINELISEGWVREVITHDGARKTESNKQRIFFPRNKIADKADEQVEWDEIELPENCQKYIAETWDKISKHDN